MNLLRYTCFLLLLFLSIDVSAKLTCNFKADTVKGCSPLRVTFNDLSTGGGTIVYRKWDFGNGGFSNRNDPNPSRVYVTPGVYTVTLTVSDGTDTSTKTFTNYITVFKNPVPNFSFTKITNCPPVKVNFTDQTVLGDAPIATYSWDFGDLTAPGTTKNPSHNYLFKGTYSVILSVEDTNGCKGSFERKNIIVVDKPKAGYGVSKRSDCKPPLAVTFTNSSSGTGALTYEWFFGDGQTSTQKNPAHTYTTAGNFDVMLVVTDSRGCKDTLDIKKLISIGQTKADFTLPADTVCKNQPDSFKNLSIGAQEYLWTFNGSDTTSKEVPIYAFKTAGLKTIKLKASSGPTCVDSITKTLYVQEIKADYTVSYPDSCQTFKVRLKDASTISDAVNGEFSWQIGTTVQLATGLDTVAQFPYSYCRKRQHIVTYVAESSKGCKDTIRKNSVEYINSRAHFEISGGDHCAKDTLTYRNRSCIINGVKSWKWTFDSGNPGDTSNLEQPGKVWVLDTSGSYRTILQVTDSLGCKFSSKVDYSLGDKHTASFEIVDDTLCFRELFVFKNTSVDSTKIESYTWDFGDFQTGSMRHTSHVYDSIGVYKVKLTVADKGCTDDTIIPLYISGPLASVGFQSAQSCLLPLEQNFLGGIIGTSNRFYWDFGDTTGLDSVNLNPTHTYKQSGTYWVTFTVYNDTTGCKYEAKQLVQPAEVRAKFSTRHDIACSDSVIRFDGGASAGNIGFRFFWDFGNGKISNFNIKPKTVYNREGEYTTRLIVVGADSCSDTATQVIRVLPNHPAFVLNQTHFCHGDTIQIHGHDSAGMFQSYFNQQNNYVGTKRDLRYTWQINGKKDTLTDNIMRIPALVKTSVPYSSHRTDTIRVRLGIDDLWYDSWCQDTNDRTTCRYESLRGCIQPVEKELIIHDLNPIYRMQDSTLCIGDSIWFQDTAQLGLTTYQWFSGAGDSSTASSPTFAYPKRGTYFSKYKIKAEGCEDSLIIPVHVQQVDSIKFYASLTDTTCYPATTYFFDQSVGDSITWRYWDFGDGRSKLRSPLKDSLTKTFTDPGVYSVKLTVETSYGCQDSAELTQYIHIRGPYARFSMFPDSICKYDSVFFKLDTANIYTYNLEWDFSDGRVDSTKTNVDTLINHYRQAGNLKPVLVYKDSANTCERAFTLDLVIEEVKAKFSVVGDTVGCQPFAVQLNDQSVDGDTWNWDFGNNLTSVLQHPSITYTGVGRQSMQLIYSNSKNGCKDTVTSTVNVQGLPDIRAFGDSMICRGDSAAISATGAKTYVWSPNEYIANPNIFATKVAPEEATVYTVLGTDSNGCKNKDSVLILIQKPPVIILPEDTSLIIGEEMTAVPKVQNGYTYRWEPNAGVSCDTCSTTEMAPLETTNYTLFVKDSLGCFQVKKSFTILVDEKYSLDVADAFTPNGDGFNDIIYPAGWGLKEVTSFKVFNRWGELLFESTPEQLGWNGYYKGELQNQETYLWRATAISHNGEEVTKEGFFSLFR